MNETQNESSVNEWLTVSQAAALVGVSEKTLRKRIAKGEIKAEKVKLSAGGWAWRVEASRLEAHGIETEAVGSRGGSFQPREGSLNELEAVGNRLEVPTASNRVTDAATGEVPSAPGGSNDAMAVALVSQLQSENAFLRAQIEAANRQAAEATAALREYLKMQARALPESISSTRYDAASSPENAPQAPINAATGKVSADAQSGLRGEGLRELRTIFRKILGIR